MCDENKELEEKQISFKIFKQFQSQTKSMQTEATENNLIKDGILH